MTKKKKDDEFYFKKSAIYKIVVEGEIDESWSERFNLQITRQKKVGNRTVSFLVGKIADQAALSSVLNLLYDMQLTVISVNMLTDMEEI